jgi:hypothetical protein
MSEFHLTISCPLDEAYAVTISDDGRVAYAYLTWYGDTVSDVWLYNRAATPAGAFLNTDEMPPLNPADYIKKDITITPISDASQVRCEWDESKDGDIEVAILLRDKFIAELIPGAKPGYSVLVVKDGPLALIY